MLVSRQPKAVPVDLVTKATRSSMALPNASAPVTVHCLPSVAFIPSAFAASLIIGMEIVLHPNKLTIRTLSNSAVEVLETKARRSCNYSDLFLFGRVLSFVVKLHLKIR